MRFTYTEAQISALLSEFTDPQVREATELTALPEMLKGISYFIDVGANVGQYVFHAAKYLQSARIVAVEANPLLVPVLNRTVEDLRSHDHGENTYEVRAAAISDIPEAIEFHISRFPTLSSVTPNAEAETVRVPTLQLDQLYVPGLRTLIKIDVEGAEYRAIRSGSRFLQSHQASFFVELHSWGDRSIRKYPLHVCWLFFRYGFALRKIGTHYFFYCAPLFRRLISFASELPFLMLKYLVCRFAPRVQPAIQRLRNRFAG